MLEHYHRVFIGADGSIQVILTMEFVLVTLSGTDLNASMSGTVLIDEALSSDDAYTLQNTLNYTRSNNLTGRMHKYENYVKTLYENDYFSTTGSSQITYSGAPVAQLYDSSYGSISVESITPLVYSSKIFAFPDQSGQLVLNGDNSSIQLDVLSGRHVKLELNLDGQPGNEVVRYVLWDELENSTSMSLADSDSDGMHDSWEISFGLDPNTDDSADDLDNDGLTNFEEYQEGYNPNDPLSPTP